MQSDACEKFVPPVSTTTAKGGGGEDYNPAASWEDDLREAFALELERRGVRATWLPDMAEHLWDNSACLEEIDDAGERIERKSATALVDEVMQCLSLPKNPGCASSGCPDSLTLMIHEVPFLSSSGNKVLYYNPECHQHGMNGGTVAPVYTTVS